MTQLSTNILTKINRSTFALLRQFADIAGNIFVHNFETRPRLRTIQCTTIYFTVHTSSLLVQDLLYTVIRTVVVVV